MTEAEAFLASIRTRVGQIKKAQRTPTADAWGQIEIACDKLLDAAASFERAASPHPDAAGQTAPDPSLQNPQRTQP